MFQIPSRKSSFFGKKKPGGRLRLCVDYRKLNEIAIKNRHPITLTREFCQKNQACQIIHEIGFERGIQSPEDKTRKKMENIIHKQGKIVRIQRHIFRTRQRSRRFPKRYHRNIGKIFKFIHHNLLGRHFDFLGN